MARNLTKEENFAEDLRIAEYLVREWERRGTQEWLDAELKKINDQISKLVSERNRITTEHESAPEMVATYQAKVQAIRDTYATGEDRDAKKLQSLLKKALSLQSDLAAQGIDLSSLISEMAANNLAAKGGGK